MTVTSTPDVELFFDPICPFCWQTSRWVRQVQRLRDVTVRWRFISLRFLNEPIGYDDRPPLYPEAHRQGTRLLRVAAAVRQDHGEAAVARLYEVMGVAIWGMDPPGDGSFAAILERHASGFDVEAILVAAELPTTLAEHADDDAYDHVLRTETDVALERVGGGVGTPVITFGPPDGPSFFGPVISELPADADALALWDAVELLARWRGFAELKRTLRTFPDLPVAEAIRGQFTRAR